jgi:hypothetical protein
MDNHGKFTCGVLAVVAVIGLVFFVPTNNTDNTKMYEDEMIVSIDDYKVLQDAVINLQEAVKLLLDQEAKRIKEG